MHRGRLLAFVASTIALVAVLACSSFSSTSDVPDASTPDVTHGDVTHGDVTDAAVVDVAPAYDGPLWDGACVSTKDFLCDNFENVDLGSRYQEFAGPETNLQVQGDPGWNPSGSGMQLAASVYPNSGTSHAYVKAAVPLGARFGVAFRLAINDRPSLGSVIGPRIAEADGPEGSVDTLGILINNRLGLQQTGPALTMPRVTDIRPITIKHWYRVILEVRRDKTAPGGIGWVFATVDDDPPVTTVLDTKLASGTLRIGVAYTENISLGVHVDDLAFFNEP